MKKLIVLLILLSIATQSISPMSLKCQTLKKVVAQALEKNDASLFKALPEDLKIPAYYLFNANNDLDLAMFQALQNPGLIQIIIPNLANVGEREVLLLQFFESCGANGKVVRDTYQKIKTDGYISALRDAASDNNLISVKIILVQKKIKQSVLNNFLEEAVSNGNVPLVELLLNAGADANARFNWNETLIMIAVFRNNLSTVGPHGISDADAIAIIKLLKKAGADINATSSLGETALDFAGRPSVKEALKAEQAKHGSYLRQLWRKILVDLGYAQL